MMIFADSRRLLRSLTLGIASLLLVCTSPFVPSAATLHATQAAQSTDEGVAETLRTIVSEANHPYLTWPEFPYYQDEMTGLYEASGYGLLWFADGGLTPQANDVVEALLGADSRGLRPSDYDAERLDELRADRERMAGASAYEQALIDAGITIAFLRFLSDSHIGRVNPRNLSFALDVEPKKLDLVAEVQGAIRQDAIAALTADVEPGLSQYGRLKAVLARYQDLAAVEEFVPIPAERVIEPGDEFGGVALLARRLELLGDLESSDAPPPGAVVYDGAIVTAMERFQERHGLSVDGVIGPASFEELNTPLAFRIRQIELALERFRWLPSLPPGPFIAVNVPAFELWAFDGTSVDATATTTMRVVVGKSLNKQTPVFMEDMRWLDFAPYWNVPYSITVNELLPAIRKDPGWVAAHNYEIVATFDDNATALPASPENIEKLGSGRLKLRQKPGPRNALGLVKFIFPNSMNIYLHSTPAQQLFARSRRDFSHGCIRVEHPVTLAEFVLRDHDGWDRESIEGAMSAGSPTRVLLNETLPVLIFYTTALVTNDGAAYFYDDIYEHDDRLDDALRGGYPYPP